MVLIELKGMEFYAYHGHFEVEKVTGNRFLVDLKIVTDSDKAGQTDDLEDALDYQKVYSIVKEEMAISSNLLEHVGQRIIDRIKMTFMEVRQVTVKVSKMSPPIGGQIEKVSVSMFG